jgi:hypothetical protein
VLPLVILAVLLAACAPIPPPAAPSKPDPTKEAWYGEAVDQLTAMAREAETSFHRGRTDQAATIITKGQPLIHRLLSAPQPTLPALEAVSDLDQLYGQMLLGNGHYAWARDLFQKNLTRWSAWKPRTPETLRRFEIARSAVAECDHRMKE